MIEIEQPEIEALIARRMQAGAFETVEETLLQVLKDAPLPAGEVQRRRGFSGAEIVEAFARMPCKELDIAFGANRSPMPVREFKLQWLGCWTQTLSPS